MIVCVSLYVGRCLLFVEVAGVVCRCCMLLSVAMCCYCVLLMCVVVGALAVC